MNWDVLKLLIVMVFVPIMYKIKMTSTIVPALKRNKKFDKVNVVDVGAARASFLVELDKLVDLSKVFAVGIDPISLMVLKGIMISLSCMCR